MNAPHRRASALASAIHRDFTKPLGFKKHGLTMNRWVPGEPFTAIHVVNVQGSKYNIGDRCEVFINYGADFVKSARAGVYKEYECAFGDRAGETWSVGRDVEATATEIVRALEAEAKPFFDEHSDAAEFLARVERRATSTGHGLGELGHRAGYHRLAELWAALGHADQARAVLEGALRFFVRERPTANPAMIHRLAEDLGVGPLRP